MCWDHKSFLTHISPLMPLLQAKDLELSNPSKKAIAYTARLQGHSDFSVDASIVHIDAKVFVHVGAYALADTHTQNDLGTQTCARCFVCDQAACACVKLKTASTRLPGVIICSGVCTQEHIQVHARILAHAHTLTRAHTHKLSYKCTHTGYSAFSLEVRSHYQYASGCEVRYKG
jgi:hypothetical protein